jgi:hypothetical protein
MSTKQDIFDAKFAFERHVGEHKCSPVTVARSRGDEPCTERVPLWQAYVGSSYSAAGRWWTEHDDADRIREQYSEQTAKIGQNVVR